MTQRIFTALATMVVAAAIACGGGSSSTASTPTPTPTPKTVSLTESEFKIDPGTLSLKPGTYIFQLQNGGNFRTTCTSPPRMAARSLTPT